MSENDKSEIKRADEDSISTDLLCGDLNQGFGDNLIILRVDGDTYGKNCPDVITIKSRANGQVVRYVPEST